MTGCRICIYGNSVILGTLGLNLRQSRQFEVTNLIPPLLETQELADLKPDIIFFDLEVHRPRAILALLETLPDLMLIGVSPDSNLVKVWSGRQIQEISTQGLLEMISEQFRRSTTNYTDGADVK
jgi:hypothetical protein